MTRHNWWIAACFFVLCLLTWQEIARASDAKNEVVYQTLAMEAANQSDRGMELVAYTILVRASKRGTTPEIESLRRKQYSCWNDRKWAKAWLGRHYDQKTRHRAVNAWNRASSNPVKPRLTHYHTLEVHPFWAKGHKPVIIEGDHAFYDSVR